MTNGTLALLSVASLYGIVSGFNDGGSLLASFTSARVISPRIAVALLLIVALGPLVLGTAVAQTIGVDVIDLPGQGEGGFIVIVLCSIVVVLASWRLRVPTSMTLALVGAMVGWVLAGGPHSAVHWAGLDRVAIGVVVSVFAGAAVAFGLYSSFFHYLGGMPYARALRLARLQVFASALQAFAYGGNDMEKTLGLVGVAIAVTSPLHGVAFTGALPILLSIGTFLLGTSLGGWRVAQNIAFGVVRVRPVQALSEQLAAGGVVAVLALAGAPVSSTQTINGALVGVGASFRASAIRWRVVRRVMASWLITLPLSLLLAMLAHAAYRFAEATL